MHVLIRQGDGDFSPVTKIKIKLFKIYNFKVASTEFCKQA
jgi:hypothetical protein